jgi:hypothetical protein
MNISVPENWGSDKISDFIECCRNHSFEMFIGAQQEYAQLVAIDEQFRVVQSNLDNTKDWFSALFFLRSHSSFLASVSLAMNGQLPEAYMVLRGSIENAVYGFYLSKNPKSAEIWLQRNDGPEMKKKAKTEFMFTKLLQSLKLQDIKIGEIVNKLYEQTIEFGAHPNNISITGSVRYSETKDKRRYDIAYISGDQLSNQVCIRTCAQVGVTVLFVFRNVLKERFDILGVTQKLDQLKINL